MTHLEILHWLKKRNIKDVRINHSNPSLRTVGFFDITNKESIPVSILILKQNKKLFQLYKRIVENAKTDGAMFSNWLRNLS
jgi:hypothetical protein